MKKKQTKTYDEIYGESVKRKRKLKKDTECRHDFWIKRCSTCGEILESDIILNQSANDRKVFYDNFDKIVCSYTTAKSLAKHSVRQISVLYYVHSESDETINLRSRENVTDDSKSYSAFSSQELFRMILYRLDIKLTYNLLAELGKKGDNPTALAKIVIKHKKNGNKIRTKIQKKLG